MIKIKTCILIDFAIPGNRNVIKKEAEKILKYKDLKIEMCNVEYASKSDKSNNRGELEPCQNHSDNT
jgi:hypothetical protein